YHFGHAWLEPAESVRQVDGLIPERWTVIGKFPRRDRVAAEDDLAIANRVLAIRVAAAGGPASVRHGPGNTGTRDQLGRRQRSPVFVLEFQDDESRFRLRAYGDRQFVGLVC